MPAPDRLEDKNGATPESVEAGNQEFHGVCDFKQAQAEPQVKFDVKEAVEVNEPDLEICVKEEPECISLWTRDMIGVPFTGFICGFMVGVLMGSRYGFFLGYLGLQPYVMMAIGSIMSFPQVFVLPLGMLTDSFPIMGMRRKPYLLIAWALVGTSLCMITLRPFPEPYYCLGADGNYDYMKPPCNPEAHQAKSFYVGCSVLTALGLALVQVTGDSLIVQYSQMEPFECRGKIKAEIMMCITSGVLVANLVVAFLMNGKEYLGTFDWGLGYHGIMIIGLVGVTLLFVATVLFVKEPPAPKLRRAKSTIRSNLKDSWSLMKCGAFMSILMFGFSTQMMVHINTTAGPLVKSRWAEVKVLPAQLYHLASSVAEMLCVYLVKRYLLHTCWRRMFIVSCAASVVLDAIPAYLTVFNVVRNQYFYLGEEILSAMPLAAIKLVSGLVLIEMTEPGREGLCIGLMGTVTTASGPFGTAISNQLFGLFRPSLSDVKNFEQDTDAFRRSVALSYLVTYGTTLASFFMVFLIPKQKEQAQLRRQTWGKSSWYGLVVLLIPGLSCGYALVLLILTNMESTSCLKWVGGNGC